jgi:predicted phosphodiesterase
MRSVWITDIHLDFLHGPAREAFFSAIMSHNPNAVFLTGDISVASSLLAHLRAMSEALNRPVYFVLGNHDFYYGSIADVRGAVRGLCHAHPLLTHLPNAGVIPLTASTALVGHDWWGDNRYDGYATTPVKLNDLVHIKELTGFAPTKVLQYLMHLGDEAASYLREILPRAFQQYQNIILLTHVPPLRESCWYQGQVNNDEWRPFFACQTVSEVLRMIMQTRPHSRLTVYCGHTHNSGTTLVLPNLKVFTGAAEYGTPQVNAVIEIE